MSTLTKVLIVLMVVFSVVASVVFIQFSNTTANYREAWQTEVNAKNAANQAASAAKAEANSAKSALTAQKESSELQLGVVQGKLGDAVRQADEYRQAIADLNVDKVNLTANNAGLTAALQQQTARANELAKLLEERNTVVQGQNAQLQDQDLKLKEFSRDLTHATESAQKKHELAAAMEARVKELEDLVRRAGLTLAADAAAPKTAEKIEGRVLAVAGEHNVAQLNVGSASGVEPGMEFILYRGDTLLGKLSVSKVDATTCAGTLSDIQMTVQKGDMATTRLTTN